MPRTGERGYCMAWCRRFGLQSTLVSPDAPHAPSCHSAAGINGAHTTVCAALLLLRMCVHPISDYLLRGLFPGGKGEQDRYAEPTHFLVKRHHALL